ncbi:MAG: AAA family ATPase [Bacteroidetes bacterium]|nr:AAA family ATPase [Bacteroidota bacterium]
MAVESSTTAIEFLNYTAQHVYLTGKAGTGKTTFLRGLAEHCSKPFIVVAPTGVAALNAGGVTIHSQFLFPLGAYLAEGSASQFPHLQLFDSGSLNKRHPINAARRKVLQGIELLVIDEISMVRADMLDAIDKRLRQARRKQLPFGGVQLLMIGDLYQLPPIMPEAEWQVLKNHYPSPHFFHSKSLSKAGFIQIELHKVYRQQDDNFVAILNRIRHNQVLDSDLDLINKRTQARIPQDAIHLVTHRQQAQNINTKRLEELDAKEFSYSALIRGDFPERNFPAEEQLKLKLGAQVMFIKNDTEEGAYYNGKLAEIIELEKDGIWVKMEDQDRFKVPKDTWKNSRYKLNDDKQSLDEEVLGEFSQYPLRLAWAITIHKSQGLSFEQAIIDLGRAFAPGQAYVALTRLRSLEGLYLKEPLRRDAMIVDIEAQRFSLERSQENLEDNLKASKEQFKRDYLLNVFQWRSWPYSYTDFWQSSYEKLKLEKYDFKSRFKAIESGIIENEKHAQKFQAQLYHLMQEAKGPEIQERLDKARAYFLPRIEALLVDFQALKLEYAQLSRTKLLVEAFELPIQEGFKIFLNLNILEEAYSFFNGEGPSPMDIAQRRKPQLWEEIILKVPKPKLKAKAKRAKKGETYIITYNLIKEAKRPAEIAKERSLSIATIYRHCQKGLKEGILSLNEVLDAKQIQEMQTLLQSGKAENSYQWSLKHPQYHQDEWRLVLLNQELESED